jgi:hypothetical protein
MDSDQYERADRMYHHIDTGEARPIRPLPRRPMAKEEDMVEMLDDMHRRWVIEESDSPWPSPSFSSGRTETCTSA